MKRTPLRRVSDKRRKEMAIYAEKRKAFLTAHPWCMGTMKIWGVTEDDVDMETGHVYGRGDILLKLPRATDVHHVKKRGKYYLDESSWMAVSRTVHTAVHERPGWARREGLLA